MEECVSEVVGVVCLLSENDELSRRFRARADTPEPRRKALAGAAGSLKERYDMSLSINIASAYPSVPFSRVIARSPTPPAALTTDGDRVEFSSVGRTLSRVAEESSFRIARVRAIRDEIENGTYETPERINGTVERLVDVLA